MDVDMFDSSILLHNFEALELHVRSRKTGSADRTKHGWSGHDHSQNISVSEDRQTATHCGQGQMDGVRGRYEYSAGIHLFEIHWNPGASKDDVILGIATPDTKLAGNTIIIGLDDQSVGWNLVTREVYFNGVTTKSYPDKDITIPDRITLILDMNEGTLSFKGNNGFYGIAQNGLKHIATGFHVAGAFTESAGALRIQYLGSSDSIKMEDSLISEALGSLSFHQMCGENVQVDTGNNRKALKRSDVDGRRGKRTVITNRPLQNGELFQLQLDKTTKEGRGSFQVGVTTVSPDQMIEFPEEMSICKQGQTWLYSGYQIKKQATLLEELNGDMRELKTGDSVAVMLDNRTLQFYINGNRQTSLKLDGNQKLYGFVDIYGQVSAVSIKDEKYSSPATSSNGIKENGIPAPRTEYDFYRLLESTMLIMKQTRPSSENIKAIPSVLKMINRLYKVYLRAFSQKQKQLASDKLANINGARVFVGYFLLLKNAKIETNADAALCYHLLRELCFEYSDNSLILCKKFGEAGILESCIKDMMRFKDVYQNSERAENLLKSAMGIITNCAKAVENHPVFIASNYMDLAPNFTNPKQNPMWLCMGTFLTMSYVYQENQTHFLHLPKVVAERFIDCLKNALKENSHKHSGWTAIEIINGLSNLSSNTDNIKTFVENGIVIHLLKMTEVGNDHEQELALNALWKVILDENKAIILKTPRLRDRLDFLENVGNEHIKNAARRVNIRTHITHTQMEQNRRKPRSCEYKNVCKRFLSTLHISEHFLEPEKDCCYCVVCHSNRGDKTTYSGGQPKKEYGIPVGWSRFAFGTPPKAKALDVFNKWHRAYHGTKKDHVKGILEVGEIVPAGRNVIGGAKIKEQAGHFNDDHKPFGFDTKQIFLSPSVRYSGVDAYATPSRYYDSVGKKSYLAKVILQVVINPDSYETGAETIGAREQLDPCFSNEEMEWSTNEQGSTILYGLLIKLDSV